MRYVRSALFVFGALALAQLLAPYLPYPFLFPFLASVVASAWFGGIGPGLFAVLLSGVVVDYHFIPPINHFTISLPEVPDLCSFVISAAMAAWLSTDRERLEHRVEERTAELQQTNEALRTTQTELAHAARVMTMGEIVVSIAHEFSQPLLGVLTNAGAGLRWLDAEPANVDEARSAMQRIVRDGNRARDVLAQVRTSMRKAEPKKVQLDVRAAIADVIMVVESEIRRHKVSLRFETARQLPSVLADRVQLQQVVLNLLLNAIDAVRSVEDRPRTLRIHTRHDGGGELVIAIEDSGAGIASHDRERIFDAFFTTKAEGLGMGLSISRSIVEAHGGRLWVTSKADGGSVFQFTLPVTNESLSP